MLANNYRIEFILSLANIFGPPFVISIGLSYFWAEFFTRSIYLQAVFYCLTTLSYWTAVIQYDVYAKKTAAAKQGAVLAPEVKGRWPGNIDVILWGIKTFKEGYPMEHVLPLFDELQTDTLNLRILWKDTIITRDHHAMQAILATGFSNFAKGSHQKTVLFDLFGDGIFNTDGEEWKAHRALTRPFFARERVREFTLFDRYADKVIDIFKARAASGESVDVQDVFGRFTMDAAGEFLFGTDQLNSLDLPLSRPRTSLGPAHGDENLEDAFSKESLSGRAGGVDFLQAFENIQTCISMRFRRSPFWPIFELFKNSTTQHNRMIDEWIMPLVQKAIDEKEKRGDKKLDEEDGSLTDHIVESTTDRALIRDELFNILLASRDTTASLLTFMIYMLSQHPEIVERLRSEISEVVSEATPTYENLRNLKYLRACVNETLRLFPPVPQNVRSTTKASVLPAAPGSKPIYVPGPHVSVGYLAFVMQRRADLWGSDAEEFVPERWLDPKRIQNLTMDPFKFLPFNAGPRICLGQNFAYNEASFLMVRLLQVFDAFELCQEDAPVGSIPPESWKKGKGRKSIEKVRPKSSITLRSEGGMWIRMSVAKP